MIQVAFPVQESKSGFRLTSNFLRSDMRPEFRFPRSVIFLMLAILGGIIVVIGKAAGAVGHAVLFALRRTGVHKVFECPDLIGRR